MRRGRRKDRAQPHTEILDPHRSTGPILTDLIIPKRKDAREETIIKDRIMIIIQIPAVAVTAAVTQVIFKGDICSGRVLRRVSDVVCGSVAVLVIDALGLAGVHIGVVPKGKGRVWGYGVVRIIFVADGREAFVVVLAGAVVEGEYLVWSVECSSKRQRRGAKLTPLDETQTTFEEWSNIRIENGRVSSQAASSMSGGEAPVVLAGPTGVGEGRMMVGTLLGKVTTLEVRVEVAVAITLTSFVAGVAVIVVV